MPMPSTRTFVLPIALMAIRHLDGTQWCPKKNGKTKHASELGNFSVVFGGGGTGGGHFSMKNGCSDMEITDSKQGGGADLRL